MKKNPKFYPPLLAKWLAKCLAKRANLFFMLSALLSAMFYLNSAQAGMFDSQPQFLKADDAFQFSSQQQGDQLQLNWQIADGYYLYKKEIQLNSPNNQVKLGEIAFPKAELHHDDFFGDVEIYQGNLALPVQIQSADDKTQLEVIYQGCTKGFCYPPESKIIELQAVSSKALNDKAMAMPAESAKSAVVSEPVLDNTSEPLAEQDKLAQSLFNSKYAVFWFFLLGVGLAFTPCVLPMLPLLSAIVIGTQQRPSTIKAFALSLIYVQGMALTYTLLGLTVAAIGLPFQVALQSPYVLIGLSIVFLLLALSMFGLFSIQLPNSWQNKLNQISQNQKGGAFGGVFVMGMVAGLVASPCTSAPLSGALLYVAQSGDLFTGAITLYLLALGMGLPLIGITLFGNKILPKSGNWLNSVKTAFGFVMLALPVFLISRVLPSQYEPMLWSLLGTAFFIWLSSAMGNGKLGGILRIVFLILAMVLSRPLQNALWSDNSTAQAQNTAQHLTFKRISNYQQLQQALAENPHQVAMLDLYADWCVACKEFEKFTFSDPNVQKTLSNILLLQVDMSKNSAENKELTEKLKVLGLPTIIFFDKQGIEINGSRITGFLKAEPFNQQLMNILNK